MNILTSEEVKEFQQLALKEMGVELSLAEAEDQGGRLIQLFERMTKTQKDPVEKEEVNDKNE